MCGAILPLPPYVFMAWYLVKHGDNFTCAFTRKKPAQCCFVHQNPQLWLNCKRHLQLECSGNSTAARMDKDERLFGGSKITHIKSHNFNNIKRLVTIKTLSSLK